MGKANDIEKKALELSEEAQCVCGVYVVDVSYAKNQDGDYSLCYYIDKDGGVGIDDCESFSKAVEERLDNDDIIASNYLLEVSSPGADRTLRKEREFLYYIGREVDVKLYSAVNGMKEFSGILKDFKDGEAYIEYNGEIIKIPAEKAVYIKLTFKF